MYDDDKLALVIVVFVVCAAGAATAFLTHDSMANSPTNHDVAIALVEAAHGGPLPGSYEMMPAAVTAVEHSVERSRGSDIHVIDVSVAYNDRPVYAKMLLVTDAGVLLDSCGDGLRDRLEGGLVSTVSGCWALPPGEEPLGAVVTTVREYGPMPNEYRVLHLPLFGAPAPPGLVCEPSVDGTTCVQAGR